MIVKLPDLPKQIKKREADFGLRLRKWLDRTIVQSCVFELKQTTKPHILFSCVEPEQIAQLVQAKGTKGILIKNENSGGKPDYSYHRHSPAWVVIRFPRSFHVISIDAFLMAKRHSKSKSLTAVQAEKISTWSIDLYKR